MASIPPMSFPTSSPASVILRRQPISSPQLRWHARCVDRRLRSLRQPQENHSMEHAQVFGLMGELEICGMEAAFGESVRLL